MQEGCRVGAPLVLYDGSDKYRYISRVYGLEIPFIPTRTSVISSFPSTIIYPQLRPSISFMILLRNLEYVGTCSCLCLCGADFLHVVFPFLFFGLYLTDLSLPPMLQQ